MRYNKYKMKMKLKNHWEQFTPYLLAGTSFVLFLYLLYILFYIILLGSLVGLLLLGSTKARYIWFKYVRKNTAKSPVIELKRED